MTRRPVIVLGLGLLLVGVIAVLIARLASDSDSIVVKAQFANVSGLRTNSLVEIGGQPVGRVTELDIARDDTVLVTAKIEEAAGPIGTGATAKIRPANILGEKYLDLAPGNTRVPSTEAVIPISRTGAPVEFDDVLNVLDPPTRVAVSALLNESGEALAGRGKDFGRLLRALPPSLDQTGRLLSAFSADNVALGRLLEESDRVVGAIADERVDLGRWVGNAQRLLATTASREGQIGPTLEEAPGALRQLRVSLDRLQQTARPLGPASDALRLSAPPLRAVLAEVVPFAEATRPTLRTATETAPSLLKLSREATPVLRRLRVLPADIVRFGNTFGKATSGLAQGFPDTLGVAEGWARTIQSRDAAGHLFRTDPTITKDTLKGIVESAIGNLPGRGERRSRRRRAPEARPPAPTDQAQPPANTAPPAQPRPEPKRLLPRIPRLPSLPKLPLLSPGDQPGPPDEKNAVSDLLDFLLK